MSCDTLAVKGVDPIGIRHLLSRWPSATISAELREQGEGAVSRAIYEALRIDFASKICWLPNGVISDFCPGGTSYTGHLIGFPVYRGLGNR